MAVIKTGRNFVCAYEPLPEDLYVETWLKGPNESHLLLTQPIDRYREAVDWAVGMADQMACPLEVVPITGAEYLQRNRENVEAGIAAMSDQQRGEMRRHVVTTVAEVMRDCDDPEVRAQAHEVLVKLKVVRG